MDCVKVGATIRRLRKEKGLKQYELADKLNMSEKTVSKWERGLGAPDVNVLIELADVLGTAVENILDGIEQNKSSNGNIKNLKLYYCPVCGNILTAFDEISAFCCGRKLKCLKPEKANTKEALIAELVDNRIYIHSERAMTKQDYVCFVAYVFCNGYTFIRMYPEWTLETHFCFNGYGKILWGTNKGELFYQYLTKQPLNATTDNGKK